MDSNENLNSYLLEFKSGKRKLFFVGGPATRPVYPGLPDLAFRKLSPLNKAILAWRVKEDAEKWCGWSGDDKSYIVELSYSQFQERLARLTPEQKASCGIELS